MKAIIPLLTAACLAGCAINSHAPSNDLSKLEERPGAVTAGGESMTLLGPEVEVGRPAPDFTVVDDSFTPVRLSDFRGRPVLISAVPSLDTGVCSLQTRTFNERIASLPDEVAALTISMDLPFAQKRFCDVEGIDRLQVLSDFVDREFGANYGLLIKDRGLLARAVFVIGPDGTLLYREVVGELGREPDYDTALAEIRRACRP
ncbi:MAG: thiol peroxidase [Planctomycetota bacterium]|nr:thiol peroxidase [Planctomycetota bacterium]